MAAAPGSLHSARETASAQHGGVEGLVDLRNYKYFDVFGALARTAGDGGEETGKVGHKGPKGVGFYPDSCGEQRWQ